MRTSLGNSAGRLCALLAVAMLAPLQAAGMSADEAFADGNRLFREDLYWAALLRYEQAADAGMDTPLLHYNVGVTHYKARQYRRAAEAFVKAAESPRLEALAWYNLGLTAYADNDPAAALRWLRRARDQEQSKRIGKLATAAIDTIRRDAARLRAERRAERAREAAAGEARVGELRREPRPFHELELYARAGFGSDDNVYRAPAESYTDISNPSQPVQVDPIVQSGSFMPVSVGAKYLINSFEHESFFARYRGHGRFYSGEELRNADEYSQELAIGTEFAKAREDRRNQVFSAFTVARHEEIFFDPDNGVAQEVDGIDISERYSYLRYGPEISTRQSWRRFAFRLWGKAQLWNYENTGEVPEFDHEFFQLGGYLQYRFTRTSLLRLSAEGRIRSFSDRPSFSLDGNQPITNPSVEYYYVDYGILARQRLTGNLWLGASYVFTDRSDEYVGYNDYTRDNFGAELHLALGDSFELKAEALYRIYNFTNAFAYNNPAAPRRTLETVDGSVAIRYRLPWNLRLVGDVTVRDVASNDARIAYDRSIFMLSLEWDYR